MRRRRGATKGSKSLLAEDRGDSFLDPAKLHREGVFPPALQPGTRLGNYEVLSELGSGGMGQVYKAKDLKLGRAVAIKVLPSSLANNTERISRFEREARLLAQLNHANIATLHGLEEHDGQRFLVMELVEGETLAERISQGPIPVDEAIPLFIQIAEGLEAAHEKGITHRDLKPANIKVTPEGKAKILDFGLAKAFAGDAPAPDYSQSPTLTKGTALGAIMGTASYMSPEQARGKTIDKRTDIWAFGCCLYEALTGKKAFDGETITDILARVLQGTLELDAIPRGTPARVRRLLGRCLEKDRRRRLRDIGEAWCALTEEKVDAAALPDAPERESRQPFLRYSLVSAAALLVGFLVRSITQTPSEPMSLLPALYTVTLERPLGRPR